MDRKLSHIVAASENNIIGTGGGMAWNLPDDFRYFKNITWGFPIIMGRKTFESMASDLKGRINIVVTGSSSWSAPGTTVVHSIEEGIKKAEEADTKEIFIIGGGKIFAETMPIVNRIYLTRVHAQIDGDTHYPTISTDEWKRVSSREHPADEKHKYAFTFEVWERK
ncbi:MAG: dihydrofolate reductase [Chitinophagaceae bacterium]|nr:dihydrofolate reductase [Chitinophagaceae bacterium]MCW5915247.1 dihydrofolate reductase [Chitinophagaceae bacterium]MCZ2396416.1 dihydrofolate reductase [Chitinophagales bacterium]